MYIYYLVCVIQCYLLSFGTHEWRNKNVWIKGLRIYT
jgi:hypothetical protein